MRLRHRCNSITRIYGIVHEMRFNGQSVAGTSNTHLPPTRIRTGKKSSIKPFHRFYERSSCPTMVQSPPLTVMHTAAVKDAHGLPRLRGVRVIKGRDPLETSVTPALVHMHVHAFHLGECGHFNAPSPRPSHHPVGVILYGRACGGYAYRREDTSVRIVRTV